MNTVTHRARDVTVHGRVSFLWLEITGRCGLECTHCYAQSGPNGSHGMMTASVWRSVISQAAELGVSMVQFIGGEPTLHPDFPGLLSHAGSEGLAVEVYTNLTHVKDPWWDLFACPSVSLATSYYSDDAREHDRITGRPGSHDRTLANIRQAVTRQIPIRASIIGVGAGQRTGQARAELEAAGVTRIKIDRLRRVGRGGGTPAPGVSELCGNCGRGVAAVLPSGDVCPCVFARWMTVGNVRRTPLAEILSGQAMAAAVAAIPRRSRACGPDACSPSDPGGCSPAGDGQCGPSK